MRPARYDGSVIPAIVLAAGKSTRMGRTKALLPYGDGTLLTHIVGTLRAAGVEDVVVVLGHDAAAVGRDLASRSTPARVVVNAEYESGQLSSLLAGIDIVDRPGVVAALVTLVDVPLVSPSTVRAVIERYRQTHAPVVRPMHAGRFGHPMLIDRSVFGELRRADPALGAKPVVRAHATDAGTAHVDDEGCLMDVDTPADYDALIQRSRVS